MGVDVAHRGFYHEARGRGGAGIYAVGAMAYFMGLAAPYRREFGRLALDLLRSGELEALIQLSAVGYHMIRYRDDVLAGDAQLCIHTEAPGARVAPDAPRLSRGASGAAHLPML